MAKQYYVNKNQQTNSDHEVHTTGCSHMPLEQNRISLGSHENCRSAVSEAKKHYNQVNGYYLFLCMSYSITVDNRFNMVNWESPLARNCFGTLRPRFASMSFIHSGVLK